MAIRVIVDREPETMSTKVFVYNLTDDPAVRLHLTPEGRWQETGPARTAVLPTYVIPDDVLSPLLGALGLPVSDAALLESLRIERQRVDRMIDQMSEAVTRGL
jgi:hypothetical protein